MKRETVERLIGPSSRVFHGAATADDKGRAKSLRMRQLKVDVDNGLRSLCGLRRSAVYPSGVLVAKSAQAFDFGQVDGKTGAPVEGAYRKATWAKNFNTDKPCDITGETQTASK